MMCRIKKAIGLALAAVGMVFAQSAQQWQNLYPAYNGLAFGDGKFVAVSGDGLTRVTSDGGAAWSQSFVREGGNSRQIYAVTYGIGEFVALQNGSSYLHSGDGAGWVIGTTGISSSPWKDIAFGDAKGWCFAAVDAEGMTAVFNEADGWLGGIDSYSTALSRVVFGAGKFVAVGDGIKSSANARGWSSTNISSSTQVGAVAFGNDMFVALSKNGSSVYTSTDGSSWTTASASGVPADMADMAFGKDKFVAVGAAGKGCASSDGTTWTSFTMNEADNFTAVKYGSNTFIALGAKGSVYKSDDGLDWKKLAGNSVTSYKQIVFGGGKYVAVGDSGVSVSSDGKNWEMKSNAKNLVGAAFGDGKYVAVGSDGTIVSSSNGDTWEGDVVDDVILTSVAFGGGVFVAGGRTTGIAQTGKAVIYSSTDGKVWNDQSNDLTGWNQGQYPVSMCFGKDKIIAAVSGNKSMKTCDATSGGVKYWSNVSTLPEQADGYAMVSAAYTDNKFVVLGTKSTGEAVVLNSEDAENWQAFPIPQEIKWVRSATFAKGANIAVADSGNIYAYVNNSWILQGKSTNRNLSTIYSGNDVILAAGANGALLYSDVAPTSIRHTSAPRKAAASKNGVMSLARIGRTSAVTLSFTPNNAGTVAVYSLNGKQLYKTRLDAGERSVRLPERVMSSGSVIVRYSSGGRTVSQRFQFVR